MRIALNARPVAALVAACLMVSPLAAAQTALPTPSSPGTQGKPTVQPASTPEALSSQLVGKTVFLRGFYQDDKLEFAVDGRVTGAPQKGSFALSAVEIDKIKYTKHSMEIEAHRVGLHFFGALPYEDDTKPFERIKVDPKKTVEIEIERLVIEPEKKKKKKHEDEKEIAKGKSAGTTTTAPPVQAAAAVNPSTEAAVVAPSSASSAEPAIAPNHDPRVSFLELSKAINVVFAPALDESVISTLPPYWQIYFATKEGKVRAARVDASAMRPGGEVKPPQLIAMIDPASNDYAQKNNIAGIVFLRMVVNADGRPQDVSIVRPIGFGLDEKAVEAVKQSQFRPGTLNGKPVPELVNLQVTFRIYSNRTRPVGTPTQVAPKQQPRVPPSNAPVLASTAGAATVSE